MENKQVYIQAIKLILKENVEAKYIDYPLAFVAEEIFDVLSNVFSNERDLGKEEG